MSAPASFEFDFHGSVSLTVAEIWPDGDAPENPTVQDVIAAIRKGHGDLSSPLRIASSSHPWVSKTWLEHWNMTDHVGCRITGPGGSEEVP